jgi:hypothetical protein
MRIRENAVNPIYYTTEEGGTYRKWEPHIGGIKVHSIFFANGNVWDAWNGWCQCDFAEVHAAYENAQQRLTTMDV